MFPLQTTQLYNDELANLHYYTATLTRAMQPAQQNANKFVCNDVSGIPWKF